MRRPHVAAVVLSWNGREDTLACLRSLAGVEYESVVVVVVVDNGSTDGSPDAVAASFPSVRLVRLERNLGFAGGMNAGIREALSAGAEAVLTLNNDMTVDPGFLGPLVDAASQPGVAAACAQILFADPPDRIWYAGARYDPRRGYQGRHTGYGRPPLPASTPPYATDRACGGAMLARREALERVGLFDEALFAYAEDVDWSLRARTAGLRVLVVPASVVRHAVSAASGGESSPATIYYGLRNSLVVAERHRPLGRIGTMRRRSAAVAAHAAQALLSAHRLAGLRAVLDGWRDARARTPGPRPVPVRRVQVPGTGTRPMAPWRDPGLWLLLHLRPPADRRGDRSGRCSACGAESRFRRNSWILSHELRASWPEEMVDRESLLCASCGSNLRVRRVADVLLALYAETATSIAALVEEPGFRALRIAEINAVGRLHPFLARHPQLTYREYPEEDLQAVSFPDASFDLLVTSETLEHVADLPRALRETRRVLAPGGRHVLTVPLDPRLERTRPRAGLPAQHHGRGGGPFALVTRKADFLAHWDVGRDFPELLRAAGFRPEVRGEGVETVFVGVVEPS